MDNEELERMGLLAIDMEMSLFLEANQLEEQAAGQSSEQDDDEAAKIAKMLQMSEAIQESIQITRNENKQAALLNSIEIVGLPDDICENSEDVANILTQIVDVKVEEQNIRGFETVEDFTGPDLGQEGPIGIHSRILVVHLTDLVLRNYIMSTSQHTQLTFPGSGRVYIYEHLTHMNRMIFRKAQQVARRLNIQFVWIQDGKIYTRKDCNSSIHQIRCDRDIRDMSNY